MPMKMMVPTRTSPVSPGTAMIDGIRSGGDPRFLIDSRVAFAVSARSSAAGRTGGGMRAPRTANGAARACDPRPHRRVGVAIGSAAAVLLSIGMATGAGAVPLPFATAHVPHQATAGTLRGSTAAPFTLANIEAYLGGSDVPTVTEVTTGFTATYASQTQQFSIGWGNGGGQAGSLLISGQGPLGPGSQVTGGITLDDGANSCSSADGSAAAQVDQLRTAGTTATSVAVTFQCSTNDGSVNVFGTVAYDIVPSTPGQGYYLYDSEGAIGGFGNDGFLGYLGDLSVANLNQPVVGMAQTPDGAGYWMVAGDGSVFAFGDAGFYGSTGSLHLNKPVVGMASTHDGKGYWFVASDGGIFAYGDAAFFGSTGSLTLNKPIVGMATTPDGNGYWLVASDGGIFAYGDAAFYGSTGSLTLNKPIVGMAATPSGHGYWLVASDGGIFAFGDAAFHGSTGSLTLNEPIEGMAATPGGGGYWLVASDGGIFAFGDAPFEGSLGGAGVNDIAGISPG